jgi:hypothetical protein
MVARYARVSPLTLPLPFGERSESLVFFEGGEGGGVESVVLGFALAG